jgi:vacuolar-type H+-ATPase subunit E/Vma4
MRSEIARRILAETPKEVIEKVNAYGDYLVLIHSKKNKTK